MRMGDPAEKRRYPRVLRAYFTAYKKYEENGELNTADAGRTLNISEGGILLEVSAPIPLLSRINISLGFDDDILKVEGEVTHLRKNAEDRIEMGIRFLDLSEQAREIIRRSVQGY